MVRSRKFSSSSLKLIGIALFVYIVWAAATFFLEGNINLFLRADMVGRIIYVTIANIGIGTIVSVLVIRHLVRSNFVKPEQLGAIKPLKRTAIIISVALVGGLGLFMLQNPRTTEPLVVFNAFMQVLPISIAEIIVCWALIGNSFEALAKNKGRIASVLVGAIAASVLFGIYHYAHSPPFNQTSMVLFLMLPSVATAVTYFLGRNVYAAIIVQNFMGIVGVMAGLPDLEQYRQPMIPIYALAAGSVATLIIMVSLILERAAKVTTATQAAIEKDKKEGPSKGSRVAS